ncbi:nuclear receptor subfamily 1 group I member 3-like [Gastrophryne carolinensis]
MARSMMSNQSPDWSIATPDQNPTVHTLSEDDSCSSFDFLGLSILNKKTIRKRKKKELEDGEKICAVCGDKAIGYNFHVLTCEGCKSFFRRSVNKGLTFTCSFTGTCSVAKETRQHCQACRMKKCLEMGMRKDMILSEEALLARQEMRMRKKQELMRRTLRVAAIGSLTEEQKQLISIVTEARKHFDVKFEHFECHRNGVEIEEKKFAQDLMLLYLQQPVVTSRWGSTPINSHNIFSVYSNPNLFTEELMEGEVTQENYRVLPHFADINTYQILQVIKFAKQIPDFRSLPMDDQISLLKGATTEITELQYNSVFNLDTYQWECGKIIFSIEDCAYTGYQRVCLEAFQKFHITLRKLNLHDAEYSLMQALALFSPDRTGIVEHKHIDTIQENIALTLKCYIDYHHPLPESRLLYAKLLSLMAEFRNLDAENTKQMIRIQTLTSDAMTPLMIEIIISSIKSISEVNLELSQNEELWR